jgi:hypothetical protein
MYGLLRHLLCVIKAVGAHYREAGDGFKSQWQILCSSFRDFSTTPEMARSSSARRPPRVRGTGTSWARNGAHGRQRRQPVVLALRPPIVDADVAPFHARILRNPGTNIVLSMPLGPPLAAPTKEDRWPRASVLLLPTPAQWSARHIPSGSSPCDERPDCFLRNGAGQFAANQSLSRSKHYAAWPDCLLPVAARARAGRVRGPHSWLQTHLRTRPDR